jgi:hypothetical protein
VNPTGERIGGLERILSWAVHVADTRRTRGFAAHAGLTPSCASYRYNAGEQSASECTWSTICVDPDMPRLQLKRTGTGA